MAAFLLSTLHAAQPYSNELLTALVVPFVALMGAFAIGPVFHHRSGGEGR